MEIIEKITRAIFGTAFLICIYGLVAPYGFAHVACNPMTYAQCQDSEFRKWCGYGSVYTKDNNTWVLTEYARKRFAMPSEWQDDGLKRAEIAAFRIEPSGRLRCHGKGESRKCVPSYECVLELWIKSDVDIFVIVERKQDFKPWKSSIVSLAKRNPYLKEKWEKAFCLQKTELVVSEKSSSEGLNVIGYDVTKKKDLSMVTLHLDGRISLLPADVYRAIRFPRKDNTYHTVVLPTAFWKRVLKHHEKLPELSEKNWYGGEEVDNILWVYTKEFAEMYNMPLSEVSKQIKGAMAVAYNITPTGQNCSCFSKEGTCVNGREDKTFDFYLHPSIMIPYSNHRDMICFFNGRSVIFLHGQNYQL